MLGEANYFGKSLLLLFLSLLASSLIFLLPTRRFVCYFHNFDLIASLRNSIGRCEWLRKTVSYIAAISIDLGLVAFFLERILYGFKLSRICGLPFSYRFGALLNTTSTCFCSEVGRATITQKQKLHPMACSVATDPLTVVMARSADLGGVWIQ